MSDEDVDITNYDNYSSPLNKFWFGNLICKPIILRIFQQILLEVPPFEGISWYTHKNTDAKDFL